MFEKKENKFWLVEDIENFKTLKKEVNIVQIFLSDIGCYCIESKINNSSDVVNDKHVNFDFVLENINNENLKLNSIRTELRSLKKIINKNLENKKINSSLNFIIKFLTFGKINRNKAIDTEISKFKLNYQNLKNKCQNLLEELKNKEDNILIYITKRNYHLIEKINNSTAENKKLEIIINDNNQKIKELKSNIEKNNGKIKNLVWENQEYKNVQDQHNQKRANEFSTLQKIIKEQDEKIIILSKENQRLVETKDSGIEKNKINTQQPINTVNNIFKKLSFYK